MKFIKSLGMAVGIAALAACGTDTNEADELNADINAMEPLPPVDTNIDLNADMNADMNAANDMNMADNAADNTTNAY